MSLFFKIAFLITCFCIPSQGGEIKKNMEKIREVSQIRIKINLFVKKENIAGLEKLGEKVKKQWISASENNNEEKFAKYSFIMLDLCNAFNSLALKNHERNATAEDYILLTLSKYKLIPLEVLEKNAVNLYCNDINQFSGIYFKDGKKHVRKIEPEFLLQFRKKRLALWLQLFGYINSEIDPNWKEKEEPNFSPPLPKGLTVGVSGMSPSSIKDPKLRKEYEANIKKHDIQVNSYNRQIDLRNAKAKLSKYLLKFIADFYARKPYNNLELSQYLDTYLNDPQLKSSILETLKQNQKVIQ